MTAARKLSQYIADTVTVVEYATINSRNKIPRIRRNYWDCMSVKPTRGQFDKCIADNKSIYATVD